MTTDTDQTELTPPPLQRSRERRMVAGVAGAIGHRFEVDPNLVRAGFVVLSFAWGLGIALYLTLWALIPEERDPLAAPMTGSETRRSHILTALLLLAALGIGLAGFSAFFGRQSVRFAFGPVWILALVALVAILAVRSSAHLAFGRILLAVLVVAAGSILVLGGVFAGLVASSGVPFSTSVGNRIVEPTTLSDLGHDYRLGAGNLTLDLAGIRFTGRPVTVHASVGVGRLVVELPSGVHAAVDAHTGVGNVGYLPSGAVTTASSTPPALILKAVVGVGNIEIDRGAP